MSSSPVGTGWVSKGVVRTAVTFLLTVRDIAENQPCFTALEGLLCSRKISGAEGVCHDFK